MAIVTFSSSTGSASGDGGGSAGGSGGSSSNFGSSSHVAGSFDSSQSRDDRIWHGGALFLLEGGVVVDGMDAEPTDGWSVIAGYTWGSHDVGSYESEIKSRGDLLQWANQSYLVCDEEDARLIRLSVSRPNERVFHGKGTSVEDFFFVYTFYV